MAESESAKAEVEPEQEPEEDEDEDEDQENGKEPDEKAQGQKQEEEQKQEEQLQKEMEEDKEEWEEEAEEAQEEKENGCKQEEQEEEAKKPDEVRENDEKRESENVEESQQVKETGKEKEEEHEKEQGEQCEHEEEKEREERAEERKMEEAQEANHQAIEDHDWEKEKDHPRKTRVEKKLKADQKRSQEEEEGEKREEKERETKREETEDGVIELDDVKTETARKTKPKEERRRDGQELYDRESAERGKMRPNGRKHRRTRNHAYELSETWDRHTMRRETVPVPTNRSEMFAGHAKIRARSLPRPWLGPGSEILSNDQAEKVEDARKKWNKQPKGSEPRSRLVLEGLASLPFQGARSKYMPEGDARTRCKPDDKSHRANSLPPRVKLELNDDWLTDDEMFFGMREGSPDASPSAPSPGHVLQMDIKQAFPAPLPAATSPVTPSSRPMCVSCIQRHAAVGAFCYPCHLIGEISGVLRRIPADKEAQAATALEGSLTALQNLVGMSQNVTSPPPGIWLPT
mmetsp:Transcript_64452/g.114638  ORF Transcript_64452/g.114638 Transcript_64452/m.114638 type:complete len:518 (-) Transcript_64452:150-1703(-)